MATQGGGTTAGASGTAETLSDDALLNHDSFNLESVQHNNRVVYFWWVVSPDFSFQPIFILF